MSEIVGFEVLSDERVGEGGFLTLRRLRLKLIRADGSRSGEGLYDYVERPMGTDAVVLALWQRAPGGARVLVRDGLRIPLCFGRARAPGAPPLYTELVAGILEAGEQSDAAICRRAADEAHEEAGLEIDPAQVIALGAPVYPTAGMCPERFHLLAAEVSGAQLAAARVPAGDGSPFEEGARVRWLPLDEALAECARGAITDLKTEVLLRRLKDYLDKR